MTRHLVLTPEAVARLTTVTDPWFSCDDCFDALDTMIENALTRGVALSTPFAVHLRGCSVCREEAQSLVALIASEHGLDAEHELGVLDLAVRASAT